MDVNAGDRAECFATLSCFEGEGELEALDFT